MTKQVAIIGAGITGLVAAYYLTRAGYNVSVFEQERYPAMRTSFANGGQVSVSNSEVWTTWSNVKKGIKWMFTKDAPLLIRPTLEWAKIKWMSKFLVNTISGEYARNTAETIRMGLEARKLYKEIIEEEKLDFDQSFQGILHFYKDENYFKNANDVKDLYEANGCQWDILDAKQVAKKEPTIKTSDTILGGAWTKDDWVGDIHKFCTQLHTTLATKYKVKFFFGVTINDINEINEYDIIVLSNGVGSTALAETAGDKLDVYPVKGYSITIELDDESYKHTPKTSLLDDQAKIVTATLGKRFRVAGTAELTGENYDIRMDRIKPLLDWVHTNFPGINTHNYSTWACLRPMTPNMMPIIKQSENNPKLFYHTGHGHLGWTLSPATAKKLVEIIDKS